MKKYILFFIATLASFAVKAQDGYNYYEWGWGVDAGLIRGYTNVTKQFYHPSISLNAVYNYNPYLPVEFEIQKGALSGGGSSPNLDRYGRSYSNNYLAVMVHADFQLGSMIDYGTSDFLNAVKDFYIGIGIGLENNNNVVQRYSIYDPTYRFPGKDKSIDLMVPIRFGYEFKLYDSYDEPGYAIRIGYVHSFAFGEGLDGYDDDPKIFKNNAIDQYSQIIIGFKYYFGTTVAYNKQVRVYR